MSRSPGTRRFDERAAVALFTRVFAAGGPFRHGVSLGIGDDAAVLRWPGEKLVWTVDAQVEGTHFERAWLSLPDIGFRSFQAAASDLAAMGAHPVAALSALTLPRGFAARDLERLCSGQAAAARDCRCPVVGGNVARGGELAIATTLIGRARRPLTRSGAKPGDEVWLVGDVGLAAAGLALLQRGTRRPRDRAAVRALEAFGRPRALLGRGVRLAELAHAAVDVSDGLATDAARLAEASGCRLVLEQAALGRALPKELVALGERLDRPALELALGGGEDYALVATGAAARRPTWARRIGRCERGRGAFFEPSQGTRRPLTGGFDHFTSPSRA
ncbi:MAG TPA: thiamine-phosphate kinase [Polyangiaceae bacterium]|nr:thiamine-phosphate kinase [Polyangiaceae bacterium]